MKELHERKPTLIRTIYLLLLLLLNSYPSKGSGDGFQRFLVTPESVEVMEGADVFLHCIVENQQGKAQWTKDGFALGFERQVPGYPRYSYSGDPALGQHHLVISGITITEDGEYQCQVGPTQTNPPIWAAANVTVLVAPTGITILGWKDGAVVEIRSGASVTLECLVTDSRPVASIMWHKDGHLLDPGLVEERVEASSLVRRWSVRSRIALTASPEDDGKLFTCEADHPALRGSSDPLLASITLSVLHQPGPPTISGYKTGEVLVAGERRTLVCRVSGGNPRPWVTWHRQGLLLDDTTTSDAAGVINTHQLTATAADDGAIYECRVNSDLLQEPMVANVSLTVYYAPSSVSVSGPAQIQEDVAVSLTCETSESNPPASLTWLIDGEEIGSSREIMSRVSTGGWATSSELTHFVRRSAETGQITVECRAVNPAIEQHVSKTITMAITKPASPPVFEGSPHKEVVSGSVVDLSCSTRGGQPPPTVRIYKENAVIPSQTIQDLNVTRAVAVVEVTPVDNGAKVTCEVTNPASVMPLTTSFRLAVRFAPWEVSGSVTPTTVEEGAIVRLSCESSSSLPPSNITWRSEEITLDGATITNTQGAFGGTSTRSELQRRTTAQDNGKMFVCEASNGLGVPVHTTLTIRVLHPPVWLSRPPPEVDVYEGADLIVSASAAANPGPLRYWWRRGQETLQVSTASELHLAKVMREQGGNYSVTSSSDAGAINASFVLNVQYGPEKVESSDRVSVEEDGRVSIQCSASGNPVPHLTWTREPSNTHNSSGAPLASGVGVARLVMESARRADTGVYLCHARNVVGSAPPTRTYVVVAHGVAAAEDLDEGGGLWAAVGGIGRLVCNVRAAPPPTFVWSSQSGLILLNSDKFTIHESQLLDGLELWSSVLEVKGVAQEDYTIYRCTAHNPLGAHTLLLSLKPPARPQPPTNFSVNRVTDREVWLTWTPILDRGAPSGYTLRYRSAISLVYQYVEVSGGGTTTARVTGLAPATEYTAAIQATNDHGRSHFVSLSFFTLLGNSEAPSTTRQGTAGATSWQPDRGIVAPDPDGVSPDDSPEDVLDDPKDQDGGSRTPRLILLIMTLTGAALLALNISIIACFVRRRAINRNPSMTSSKSSALGSIGATPVPTPALNSSHSLPLSSMSSNSFTNPAPSYKAEQQTMLEESELKTLAPGDIAISANTHILPCHNGGIITTKSTFLVLNNTAPKTTVAVSPGPSQPWTRRDSSSSRSASPEEEPSISHRQHDLVNFTTEPDVCSVASSFYDNALQEDHRRRSLDLYPADDTFSLCSNRSNNSRIYSQGFLRPLSSLGVLQQQAAPQLIQDTFHAHPRLSPGQQRLMQQNASDYSSLNPSGLYDLRAENNPDSKRSLISFTAGCSTNTPPGYSTLGPRQRRTKPPQFTIHQRRPCAGPALDPLSTPSHYDNFDLVSRLHQENLQYDSGTFGPHAHHQHENSGSSGYSSSPHQEARRTLSSHSRYPAGETTDIECVLEVPEASSTGNIAGEDSPDSSSPSTSRGSSDKAPALDRDGRVDQQARVTSQTHTHNKNRER
nr:nephrin-like [Procambarus clarkii]